MTLRRVPLARRIAFQDRRRAALASSGVAGALLLVLVLQGIFDGAIREVTLYWRRSPADVVVSEKNVRTMHMSVSALDPSVSSTIAGLSGVGWAEAIRYTTTFLVSASGEQQLSYVIGYDPATGRGGPRQLSTGRAPGIGEIIVERVAADRLGLSVGSQVRVFGDLFTVSGVFKGGTTIVNSIAFITTDDFAARRGSTIAYVLVGANSGVRPAELASQIQAALPGQTVQTRESFAREEAALIEDMSADLLRVMTTIAILIALAVVGLTLLTLTLAKIPEYAVVKALGGRISYLSFVVVAQAVWLVAISLVASTVAALVLGAAIPRFNPTIPIVIHSGNVARVGTSALIIATLGAVSPLARLLRIDPALAFRRAN